MFSDCGLGFTCTLSFTLEISVSFWENKNVIRLSKIKKNQQWGNLQETCSSIGKLLVHFMEQSRKYSRNKIKLKNKNKTKVQK